jgi:hypothetical protein
LSKLKSAAQGPLKKEASFEKKVKKGAFKKRSKF